MFVVPQETAEPFRFRTQAGEFAVPLMSDMPLAEYEELRRRAAEGGSSYDATVAYIEKHAPGFREGLTVGMMRQIIEAYTEASKVTLGE